MKLNRKKLFNKATEFAEVYIKEYDRRARAKAKESGEKYDKANTLKELRSWSSMGQMSQTRLYVNSSDLMPELTLGENPYFHIGVMGMEIACGHGNTVTDLTIKLGDKNSYGLVDPQALLQYAIDNIDSDFENVNLSDFYIENLIPVEATATVGSISNKAKLEAKAELLDDLLSRSVNFGAK